MVEPSKSSGSSTATSTVQAVPPLVKTQSKPRIPLQKIYALPAPIRTYPLPNFYPGNPLSLVHIAYIWLRQVIFRPADEPSTKHGGTWSEETRSVHVYDAATMRALWEAGFFGKGNLSRSEPNWLKREQIRRGLLPGNVQEQLTNQRREERVRSKWERARVEQETIERTRRAESLAALTGIDAAKSSTNGPASEAGIQDTDFFPPVGPLQLLQLPNSDAELKRSLQMNGFSKINGIAEDSMPPASMESWSKANGAIMRDSQTDSKAAIPGTLNGSAVSHGKPGDVHVNGDVAPVVNGDGVLTNGTTAEHPPATVQDDPLNAPSPLKRQKSVRFSSEVESTTFQRNDPPSPSYSSPLPTSEAQGSPVLDLESTRAIAAALSEASEHHTTKDMNNSASSSEIKNMEHLQLSPEEAFYLAFAIGALSVVDPKTKSELSTLDLLVLFADHCFFPPRIPRPPEGGSTNLRTDDPFLVQYVVYHHFRSLGWIPREGVKFGVDWLLYRRGPVFDHAEFGVAVLPSYTDPRWEGHVRRPVPHHSWHWLLGLQRVLSHVIKSLVLVYVDIPPPSALEGVDDAATPGRGIAGLLGRYRVREIMVRRWSSNRNR